MPTGKRKFFFFFLFLFDCLIEIKGKNLCLGFPGKIDDNERDMGFIVLT